MQSYRDLWKKNGRFAPLAPNKRASVRPISARSFGFSRRGEYRNRHYVFALNIRNWTRQRKTT